MIPFVDLKAQYGSIQGEVDGAIREVVNDCSFVKGPRLAAFEREFAAFCGAGHAIGASSGTTAIHVALAALGVGPGDEVIVPSHTFIGTVEPVAQTGARVVFADVDPVTACLDPASVERCVSDRTKVIMPVHLYGRLADMAGLEEVATRKGRHIAIVEDCAQAHGARLGNRIAGGAGKLGCFSFYPGKNLGAYGDGGAVTTSDPELATRIRKLVDHGREDKYEHELLGYNYRLDTLQAAVLSVKLRHLADWNERRRSRAVLYNRLLGDIPGIVPAAPAGSEAVFHLYVIQADDRDGLRARLAEKKIATGIHYPLPVHRQPALCGTDFRADALPVTEKLVGRILSLPMFPELTDEQVHEVAAAIRSFQTG